MKNYYNVIHCDRDPHSTPILKCQSTCRSPIQKINTNGDALHAEDIIFVLEIIGPVVLMVI